MPALLTEDAICPRCNRLRRNQASTEAYLMDRRYPHKFDRLGRMVFLAPYCVCRHHAPEDGEDTGQTEFEAMRN